MNTKVRDIVIGWYEGEFLYFQALQCCEEYSAVV